MDKGQVKLAGTNFCLDVRDDDPRAGLQIWECSYNKSQAFRVHAIPEDKIHKIFDETS